MRDDYDQGFNHGCDWLMHEIRKYVISRPEPEMQTLLRLLTHLTPPKEKEVNQPH